MSSIAVQHCQLDFDQDIQNILDFLAQTKSFKVLQADGKYHALSIRTAEMLAGLALLRICLAWEEFLEDVFIRYMCGAESGTGYAPILLSPAHSTVSSALLTLLARGNYLKWGAQITIDRAKVYFDHGEPFATAIGAGKQVIEDIFIVRNRFAHRSESATQKFRALILREFGYIPRGMTAGRFLLSQVPTSTTKVQNFIELYASSLVAASVIIVP